MSLAAPLIRNEETCGFKDFIFLRYYVGITESHALFYIEQQPQFKVLAGICRYGYLYKYEYNQGDMSREERYECMHGSTPPSP